MAFRYRKDARRRAAAVALLGVVAIILFGPLLTLPAIALIALVYYAHQLAAVLAGDAEVPYPSLAFVIVVNSIVVLLVQLVTFVAHLRVSA